MRILTRYILREIASHAFIGCALFTFILFTSDLARILELVVRNSAPVPSVAEIFFLTVPVALTYTIPMGVLVGILIGLSRLSADSEITAMRASGIGVWSFLRIISIFVIGAWLLALGNSVYIAPKSQASLARLQDKLKASQISFEIQPRVFYEDFPHLVLYVQDIKAARGAALWKGIFIADMTNPAAPIITLARQGVLVSEGPSQLHLHLIDGSRHESDPKVADEYRISTFDQFDLPISIAQNNKKEEEPAPLAQTPTFQLRPFARTINKAGGWWYYIEFHRRFALPTACLVLALVGIPLGLSSKKGGKSFGFVITILLVFAYYLISLIGVSLARQGKVTPALGAWMGDIIFFATGIFLLWRVEKRPFEVVWWREFRASFPRKFSWRANPFRFPTPANANAFERAVGRKRLFRARFPMILDDYILRDFALYFVMVLGTFLVLLLVFTLFELLGDILRTHASPVMVGEYLLNVTPYFFYNVGAPLSMLLSVLITLGLMQRTNEITAIKATGMSIYRITIPILVVAILMAAGLFFFDQFYLPSANKRQDALRSMIKGKPPQTYLNPDRRWIFGQHSDIYYYQFFDSERDQFGNLNVFEFDPQTFQLTSRIYADNAHWDSGLSRWVSTRGWAREFRGSAIDNFRTFDVATFATVNEPPTYFKKEVKQSSEMNYEELSRYIRDLRQSGFEVVRLQVQLQKKLAFPLITLVMAILAIPFALSVGRRGAVAGIAAAVGVAAAYIVVSSLFEAMGNISQLPPVLAAWSPDLIFGFLGGYLLLKVPS
jgi:LPS export ABC transporter permease LptF/LPS export ABC transporter permease LptG